MSKQEMIKNGENVSLDDGNVVVLNGISIAEKEAEKEETPVEIESQSQELSSEEVKEVAPIEVGSEPSADVSSTIEIPVPTQDAIEQEIPQIPTAPIDLSGVIPTPVDSEDPTIYPQINSEPAEVAPISLENSVPFDNTQFSGAQFDSPMFGTYNNDSISHDNVDNSIINDAGGVFKSEQDVDASFRKFMADVERSYQENIAGPTKTLVNFVNKYINWGNQVTANGLNRKLFDEYDELNALLQQQKSYDDQSVETKFEYNDNSTNNYGDEQFGSGMFR